MKKRTAWNLALLPGVLHAIVLALTLPVQAAEILVPKPELRVAPKAASVPASAPPGKSASAPAKRPKTRALGSDDDLKDLEVERVRGKNR